IAWLPLPAGALPRTAQSPCTRPPISSPMPSRMGARRSSTSRSPGRSSRCDGVPALTHGFWPGIKRPRPESWLRRRKRRRWRIFSRRWPMLNLSRRDFVVSTAMAAALGLNARLAVSPAFAQKAPDPAKGFVTYKVGAAEVTALYDGIWEKPHDPAFIANASVEDVKAAMVKAGLSPDFVSIPFTVLVVKTGGKTIMCDSGTGGQVQPTAGKLAANMKAAGIDPAKIEPILISHCHPDHICGLMEKDPNKPLYPNAELIISDVEYKFWTDPAVIDRLPEARKGLARRIQAVFPTWKNIRQVEGEPEVAPGIRFISSPGHTPGPRAFHLSSGSKELMISNDTAYVPALVVANPGWHGQYDQNATMAEESRRKLLDRVIADKVMICGYHFPFPGAGTISKDGAGYALTVMKT